MTIAIAKARFIFFRSVFALMLREMTTTYGRSPGGYIWAFAEPIAGVAVMTIIFDLLTRTPALGSNFPLFFATGMLPFLVYQSTVQNVGTAIRFSKPLLAYPNVTYVDAIVARFLLNALTQLLICIVVLAGIILIYDVRVVVDFGVCARAFVLALALGFGIGVVNCYLMSMFPIWQFMWAVLNRPLFVISGIFFLVDPLPAEIRTPLLYNPLTHLIMLTRHGFYEAYEGIYVSEIYVYMISLVLGALGMLLLHRFHRIILDEGA